jgi:hypothetical protein
METADDAGDPSQDDVRVRLLIGRHDDRRVMGGAVTKLDRAVVDRVVKSHVADEVLVGLADSLGVGVVPRPGRDGPGRPLSARPTGAVSGFESLLRHVGLLGRGLRVREPGGNHLLRLDTFAACRGCLPRTRRAPLGR